MDLRMHPSSRKRYGMTLTERLELKRPKRLLSLDGGGIRGLIAAEILIKLEDVLCRSNSRWKCLADYFDFIGGTSTGAILTTGLALGMSARELKDFYVRLGPKVFRERWWIGRLWSKYKSEPLEQELRSAFGDTTLGSEKLRTLMMIVAKNVTVGNPWFFVNNPRHKFIAVNSRIPLWELVRASSAAPTFFPPYTIEIGDGQKFEFIDGGVSMFNNPSFQLFLEATIPRYRVGWSTGVDKILLISVGTGFREKRVPRGRAKIYTLFHWAGYVVEVLLDDANVQQNTLMKLISYTPKPQWIDREMEDLPMPTTDEVRQLQAEAQKSNIQLLGAAGAPTSAFATKMLTYHRYTTSLTQERFEQLHLLREIDPDRIAKLDCVDQIETLCEIGQAVAAEQISAQDFKGFLHEDW